MSTFFEKYTLEQRLEESTKIKSKYPNKIPLIVEKTKKTKLKNINKHKFLIPEDMTLAQFLIILRKRINIDSTEAIYIFVNNTLPPTSQTISSIYSQFKNEDGFLYLKYCNENTFGN